MMAVETPLPMPVAAIAAGPGGPTMAVSTSPMLIQPISARMTGPARRRRGRSSDKFEVRSWKCEVSWNLLPTSHFQLQTSESNAEANLADARSEEHTSELQSRLH